MVFTTTCTRIWEEPFKPFKPFKPFQPFIIMIDVKPDEISAILKQQLSGFSTATELEEVGTVLQVGDGIARVYGLNKAQAGELVEFETGVKAVVLNLEEDNVGVVLMGPGDGIREGSPCVVLVALPPSK